jgi:hypothetical protein
VLLRSIGGGVTLSTRPLFALIGPRADDFKAVRILQGDTVVHESALDGHVFRWPEGEPPLATAVAYTLHLVPAAPGAQAVTTRFVTPRPTSSAPDETVTLITVE